MANISANKISLPQGQSYTEGEKTLYLWPEKLGWSLIGMSEFGTKYFLIFRYQFWKVHIISRGLVYLVSFLGCLRVTL